MTDKRTEEWSNGWENAEWDSILFDKMANELIEKQNEMKKQQKIEKVKKIY